MIVVLMLAPFAAEKLTTCQTITSSCSFSLVSKQMAKKTQRKSDFLDYSNGGIGTQCTGFQAAKFKFFCIMTRRSGSNDLIPGNIVAKSSRYTVTWLFPLVKVSCIHANRVPLGCKKTEITRGASTQLL